jgi:hypothetical protein
MKKVVVLDEPFPTQFVAHFAELSQALEVVLPRCPRSEQHQDRDRLVGFVAEAVDAAWWHVQEVVRMPVDPVVAVVQLDGAGQHEECLGHRPVKVRAGSAALRCDLHPIQPVVTVGGLLVGQVVVLHHAERVVVRRAPTVFGRSPQPGTDLRLVLGVTGRRIRRDVSGIPE